MDATETFGSLCYGGEERKEPATVNASAIGITCHRVLVLLSDSAGSRFHAIDRPNVMEFASRTTGLTGHRNPGIIAGIIGVGLLVAGAAIDLGGLGQALDVPTGGGSTVGLASRSSSP